MSPVVLSPADLAKLIDHTNLKAAAREPDIVRLCREACEYGFYSVCVNPAWIEVARKHAGPATRITSVVGFPLGSSSMKMKQQEAMDDVARGADEIDMVMNVGKFKEGGFGYVTEEIAGVVAAAGGRIVKVIIETCLLTDDEKRRAAELVRKAGAHFVKTSTGFNIKGADANDVKMLRDVVGPDFGVKASGGIRDYATFQTMVRAGANRIGTSASVAILIQAISG